MSLFQVCPYFRGVLISGVSLFQGCPYFSGVLISRVLIFQGCPYFRDVLVSGMQCSMKKAKQTPKNTLQTPHASHPALSIITDHVDCSGPGRSLSQHISQLVEDHFPERIEGRRDGGREGGRVF